MSDFVSSGCLYVVATPIGNVDDISLRALRVLSDADVVAAEDTRHSRALLTRHGIDRPLSSLHEHNEEQQAPKLIEHLKRGESVALISDAGTPLLSDPGYRLVCLAAAEGFEIAAVPGPSALTAALSISGLPTDRFVFEGFLPSRRAARRTSLQKVSTEPRTLVFFESSHRIDESLADLVFVLGAEREAAVCRELTKRFETVLRGTLGELHQRITAEADQRRGEFVLVVGGCAVSTEQGLPEAIRLARELQSLLGASQAARIAARLQSVSRRAVYEALGEKAAQNSENP